ncbi:MAG: prepilin peptidase [Planctomycetota bacterium]
MRGWNPTRLALGSIALVVLTYLIVIPVAGMIVERFAPSKTSRIVEDMSLAEQVRLRTTEALTALAFASFGASIGSFLNVVAYRAPRRESVAFRRSRCPSCGKQLRWNENLPILGWLRLKGRCGACDTPISSRYIVVEAATASLFVLLYFAELISGGANVPIRKPNFYNGVVWIIFYTKWDLVRLYLFHCLAACCLLTLTLIDIDRLRLPAWLRWLAAVSLIALPAIWPDLLPVTWLERNTSPYAIREWTVATAIPTSVAGGMVGALVGWLASRIVFGGKPSLTSEKPETAGSARPPGGHMVSAGLIVGLSVGWQATIGVWILALALRPLAIIIARALRQGELPMTLLLLVGFAIQLVVWRWTSAWWWPSSSATLITWGVSAVVLAALCVWTRRVHGSTFQPPSSPETAYP